MVVLCCPLGLLFGFLFICESSQKACITYLVVIIYALYVPISSVSAILLQLLLDKQEIFRYGSTSMMMLRLRFFSFSDVEVDFLVVDQRGT